MYGFTFHKQYLPYNTSFEIIGKKSALSGQL